MTLSEFQSSLAEKIHQAADEKPPLSLLGIESGAEHWLVDLGTAGEVFEVLPVPAISEVPLAKPWFRGIANIRGTLYGVSDLSAFHGGAPTPIRAQSRLLLAGMPSAGAAGGHVALLISATQGLKPLAAFERLEPARGAETPAGQLWRGARYRDSEGRVWTHLLLSALLSAPVFLDIAV